MVQFRILSGKTAGSEPLARRFPFRVGRAPSADIRLEESGVWDEHLRFSLGSQGEVEMTVQPGALATVNREPVAHATMRNGDVIQIGVVELRFGISPTGQKGFRVRELLVWTGLAAVCLVQVAIIYWLLN